MSCPEASLGSQTQVKMLGKWSSRGPEVTFFGASALEPFFFFGPFLGDSALASLKEPAKAGVSVRQCQCQVDEDRE